MSTTASERIREAVTTRDRDRLIHNLANRVSRASQLAGSPINYYHAEADVRETIARGFRLDCGEVATFYALHYGVDHWVRACNEVRRRDLEPTRARSF